MQKVLSVLVCYMFWVGVSAMAFAMDVPVASQDVATSQVVVSNGLIRAVFDIGKPKFDYFPKGYTGYRIEMQDGGQWVSMAQVPTFSSFSFRSKWGRDWLHYVMPLPQDVTLESDEDQAKVLFKADLFDLDRVGWHFEFEFSIKRDARVIDVTYRATPNAHRELMLWWGPRLHAGEGSFGAQKDEALFPGIEYLGPDDRSSDNWALPPDDRIFCTPHPAKITVPLMVVQKDGRMIGLRWDPEQCWSEQRRYPSAVFASPNWIENEQNHLMGLFVPSVPDFVAENGLRAHQPAPVEGGKTLEIRAEIFAAPAEHTTDAVDLYLEAKGGLPQPAAPPMSDEDAIEMMVRTIVEHDWDEKAKGWPWEFGGPVAPNMTIAECLIESLPYLKDEQLAAKAREQALTALEASGRTLQLALRLGDLPVTLDWERKITHDLMAKQEADGAWAFEPTWLGESGLWGMLAPPTFDQTNPTGMKTQGITAGHACELARYAMVSNEPQVTAALERALTHMNRHAIPMPYDNEECPQSPSLHGSYYGLRACLAAYRITGNKQHLADAVYWARTGLPFVYLWSRPAQEVVTGHIHTGELMFMEGYELYNDTRRDAMIYGALYGYGSSQFMHHWFGLIVHWIGMCYADDLAELARYDQTMDWPRVVRGLLNSALWQDFDRDEYAGYMPDVFSAERWVPSGPAFSPARTLMTFLHCKYGVMGLRTTVLRDEERQIHLTSVADLGKPSLKKDKILCQLNDPGWEHNRLIVSGLQDTPRLGVLADGVSLDRVQNLEAQDEGWAFGVDGLLMIKVKQQDKPRKIAIHD